MQIGAETLSQLLSAEPARHLAIGFKDLNTRQSSLEDIFVSLVSDRRGGKR